MIKYLGSKRVLVPQLVELVRALGEVHTFLDVFSGTARVGHAMKGAGLRVRANDHNAYAHVLAQCYVAADRDALAEPAQRLLDELQALPPRPGYVTETFCERARYFQPKNGARIDAIRERIEALELPPDLRAVALVSLMEAADRVDSTTGVQMAYLKQWAPRAYNDLELRLPRLLPGPGDAHALDAQELVQRYAADVVYLDPPYNQHKYLGNYHVWETLVRWDAPPAYGVAQKRIDCKTRRSPFNSRRQIEPAMRALIDAAQARWLLVSFNNEGFISRDQMLQLLSRRGPVDVMEIAYDRYVGAKIGIYNPQGEKVGQVGHLKNVEYLFRVRCT
ncbi:MAG: DNA adenine methylase [Myxococcales bacterium]|nr:DNA adenine methylase [Myxococcales bacterium]